MKGQSRMNAVVAGVKQASSASTARDEGRGMRDSESLPAIMMMMMMMTGGHRKPLPDGGGEGYLVCSSSTV